MKQSKKCYFCSGCQRPLGVHLYRCPYCGAAAEESLLWQRLRLILPPLTTLVLLGAALQLHHTTGTNLSPWPWPLPAAIMLSLAAAVAWLPLGTAISLPGGASTLLRNQLLLAAALRFWYGAAVVGSGILLTIVPLMPIAATAVLTLLASRRALRLPCYPLMGGALAAVAHLLALAAAT